MRLSAHHALCYNMIEEVICMSANCDTCAYNVYDDEMGEYFCEAYLDEDEICRMQMNPNRSCPYYRSDDDYAIVRRQN